VASPNLHQLQLLMPEIYYVKMANMAPQFEAKHGLMLNDFPNLSDWFYTKTKVNSTH
jgi:hypothetical protein